MLLKTYTILPAEVNIEQLHGEVSASGYVTGFTGIEQNGDGVQIHGAALFDETSLDALIAAHDKDASANAAFNATPKIYRYVSQELKNKDFRTVNYKLELLQTLFPKRTLVQGELQQVEWYSDQARTDKIIDVVITYNRDAFGFALDRTTTRKWVNEDEAYNASEKISSKIYSHDPREQMVEGIKRRTNIYDNLTITTLGMMVATMPTEQGETDPLVIESTGKDFLQVHESNFIAFKQFSHQDIFTDITNATDAWLDNVIAAPSTTIRDFILGEINIWGL